MEEKKIINLVPISNLRYKINIPDSVELKISHMCKKISEVEWSGILFYTIKGNFEDNNLEVNCVDFCVMNIGNATYTEFDVNPDVVNYMMENDLLDCYTGLIHSHNKMSTFFSGTDTSTLKSEGNDTNNFVSLIVNNAGDYTAAITRKCNITKVIKAESKYAFFDSQECNQNSDYITHETNVEWFYLDIIKASSFDALDVRIKELQELKNNTIQHIDNKQLAYDGGGSFNHPNRYYHNANGTTIPIINGHKYNEPDLFTPSKDNNNALDEDDDDIDDIKDWNDYEGYYDKNTFHIEKKVLDDILVKLLSGSVLMINNEKLNLEVWVKQMENLYNLRFGNSAYGFSIFKEWAKIYIEYLTWYADDDNLAAEGLTEDDVQNICANDLYDALSKYQTNKYIDYFKVELKKLM